MANEGADKAEGDVLATKVTEPLIASTTLTMSFVSKARNGRRVSVRLAEKGAEPKTISKPNAKQKVVISDDDKDTEDTLEAKPKAVAKTTKLGMMLFEGVPTRILKNIHKKAHLEFLSSQGLTEFAKLEWKNHVGLTDAQLMDFVKSWEAAKQRGRCRGISIKTDLNHLKSSFKLKKGGATIKLREKDVYHAKSFPRNNTVRGYNILLCRDVDVKQRLEFITHVMHWKKPRSEYPRFMVKLAETKMDERKDSRKDWATFFQEGLRSTLRRAKKPKNAGWVMEIKDQLEILLDTQLRASVERRAAGEKTSDEREEEEEETPTKPVRKRSE